MESPGHYLLDKSNFFYSMCEELNNYPYTKIRIIYIQSYNTYTIVREIEEDLD